MKTTRTIRLAALLGALAVLTTTQVTAQEVAEVEVARVEITPTTTHPPGR